MDARTPETTLLPDPVLPGNLNPPLVPSLNEIYNSDPDEFVAKYTDIAPVNLACAVGLPNAGEIDIPKCLHRLNAMAEAVRLQTKRAWHLYDLRPAEFHNSKSVFRVMLMAHILYKHFGVHYTPGISRETPSFGNPHDCFLAGLLGPRKSGTCASLPILAVAVGRRLGYPLKLAMLPRHLTFRWDDGNELINFEYTGQGAMVRPNEHYYSFPETWTPKMYEERDRYGIWLTSLTPKREVAVCLLNRIAILQYHKQYKEEIDCWDTVHSYDPHNPRFHEAKADAMKDLAWSEMLAAPKLSIIEPGPELLNVADPFRDRSKDQKPVQIHINYASSRGEGISTFTVARRGCY